MIRCFIFFQVKAINEALLSYHKPSKFSSSLLMETIRFPSLSEFFSFSLPLSNCLQLAQSIVKKMMELLFSPHMI